MSDETTTIISEPPWTGGEPAQQGPEVLALCVCWSIEPGRVGQVALLAPEERLWVLGRGDGAVELPAAEGTDAPVRLRFHTQRPGRLDPAPPLGAAGISRQQLVLRRGDQGVPALAPLHVRSIGRCPLYLNGRLVSSGTVQPGDTLLLQHQLLLCCVRRPLALPPPRHLPPAFTGPFGEPDRGGMVGESAAAWRLRERLAFFARSDQHVLILGESGTGKELVARAIHALSPRERGPLVTRNAATFPTELIDAELFGNARGYPNPGMAERPGLIGEAHGGTLFLDEIGELPGELQAHLLRVLDQDGEYQRLGEARARRADLRLIGATNRRPTTLKHDFLSRFPLRLSTPGLKERIEDVPLLITHLLRREGAQRPELVRRFFTAEDVAEGSPRLDPALLDALVRHPYTGHVRELSGLLWRAMAASEGQHIAYTPELGGAPVPDAGRPRGKLTAEAIQACLDRHDGNQSRAWKELGLPNRFALHRLVKKYGLKASGGRGQE